MTKNDGYKEWNFRINLSPELRMTSRFVKKHKVPLLTTAVVILMFQNRSLKRKVSDLTAEIDNIQTSAEYYNVFDSFFGKQA